MLASLIRQLAALESLTEAQISEAIEQLADETIPAMVKAEFLIGLARKGETVTEIAVFARELRKRAVLPELTSTLRSREILDIVGTGGDRLGTFNISTTAALVTCAAGVTVAKHGNRASTSSTGSADVLDALGVPCDLGPQEAVLALERDGFAFFFAPKFHPAFRHIAPARKLCAERGQSTIFNVLGPLLNPACPSAMLVGVPKPELCGPIAGVLQQLNVRRAMVVCGSAATEDSGVRHMDELSPLGSNTVAEFYQPNGLNTSTLMPDSFPVQKSTLKDLQGGDRETNAAITRRILEGKERGPKRDAVLLNAAAALFVAGAVRSMTEGWELAQAVIDDGRAMRKLESLRGSARQTVRAA